MTVRLLHTSDWHLGQALHDVDRNGEHRAFLRWLADLCERERVHALLVSGDVFDVSSPPAAAIQLFAEFLVDLWRRLEGVRVIVVGGNHDSAHRLETTEPYLRALGRLHVLGALPRQGDAIDADRALIRVEGDGGSALVLAIPFLRAADLRAGELEGDPAAPVRRIHEELLVAARARRRPAEPLVAMGHLFVAGGAASSERQLVGGVGAVPADVFSPEIAYAALGHLHRPQTLDGRLRYSGPPIPLSFDEAAHAQEVVLVELEGFALASARGIPTPRTRPLLCVPAGGPAPLDEVLALLRALPPRGALAEDAVPLLEVRVLLERPEPALRSQLDAALEGRAARLVSWRVVTAGDGAGLGDATPGVALSDLDPIEVFRRRWASRFDGEPPAELLAAFDGLLAEARGEVAPATAAEVSR